MHVSGYGKRIVSYRQVLLARWLCCTKRQVHEKTESVQYCITHYSLTLTAVGNVRRAHMKVFMIAFEISMIIEPMMNLKSVSA